MSALKYKDEFCQMLIDHMSQGMSYETFGAEVDCGKTTLYDWEKKYPEWVEAKDIGFMKAQSFLEKRLIAKTSGSSIKQKNFDAKLIDTQCLMFALKTRFHKTYGERQKLEMDAKIEARNVNVTISKAIGTRTLEDVEKS